MTSYLLLRLLAHLHAGVAYNQLSPVELSMMATGTRVPASRDASRKPALRGVRTLSSEVMTGRRKSIDRAAGDDGPSVHLRSRSIH